MDRMKIKAARSLYNFYNGHPPIEVMMAQLKVSEAEAKELFEYVSNPPKRGRPPKKKKTEIVIKEEKAEPHKGVKPKIKASKLIYILRWPMLICAMMAFVLSCVITVSELEKRQPNWIAIPMGIAFMGFGLCASEMGFYYKQKKRNGLAAIFIAMWLLIVIYSINNVTSSFYDRWRDRAITLDQKTAQTATNQTLYDNYEKQIRDKDQQIQDKRVRLSIFQKTLEKYNDPELKKGAEYSNAYWGASEIEGQIKKLEDAKQEIMNKENQLLQGTIDVKSTTAVSKPSSYYAFVATVFKWANGDFLQFLIDLIPALVLDLISSMALYVFLFVKDTGLDFQEEK